MIPDGTSPEAIVAALVFTLFVFGLLAVWLFWYRLPDWVRLLPTRIMSRVASERTKNHTVVSPVVQRSTSADQLIATTGNAINSELSDNSLEARDIIRFQAKAEALAALIRDGQVTNIAKGIEKTFQCSRSSKDDSTYQKALRLIKPLIQDRPVYRMTPEQVENRKELGLEV